jgi:hypothetical protein
MHYLLIYELLFTHPVVLLHAHATAGNPTSKKPLPLVDNIAAIAKLEAHEDAIISAQEEIDCLHDMSLEGDIPDDVSDIGDAREKALFTGS